MTAQDAKSKALEFSRDTRLHVSVAALICMGVIVYQATMIYASLTHQLEEIQHQNQQIINSDWSYTMERDSWWHFERANPTVEVPDVENIKRTHSHK